MKFHLSLTEADIRKIICQHIERNYGVSAEPSDLKPAIGELNRIPQLEFHYDSHSRGERSQT